MKITKAEKLTYFDVDETLIFRCATPNSATITLDYYGQTWYIRPHSKHIEFLKSLKARGYHVVVHSANGWLHAKKVIEVLQLVDFVDEVKTKPIKYVDDKCVEDWFGPRIYFEE